MFRRCFCGAFSGSLVAGRSPACIQNAYSTCILSTSGIAEVKTMSLPCHCTSFPRHDIYFSKESVGASDESL